MVSWLVIGLFHAELSLERYWRGSRSLELGEGENCTKLLLHCHYQNDSK